MTDIVERLSAHIAIMAPHQKTREAGRLLIESLAEIERRHGIGGELIMARRERDELRAEVEALRSELNKLLMGSGAPDDWEAAYSDIREGSAFPPETSSLKIAFAAGIRWEQSHSEAEAMRKDAERWRSARSMLPHKWSRLGRLVPWAKDQAIDAAISEQALQRMPDEAQADRHNGMNP